MALPIPMPGFPVPETEKHRLVSVEVAALYLMSALAHGDLHFAQAPLLTDPSEPRAIRTAANTPERVARAFDAAERWHRLHPQPGSSDPIAESGLRWY
jgi:hypothetical protein